MDGAELPQFIVLVALLHDFHLVTIRVRMAGGKKLWSVYLFVQSFRCADSRRLVFVPDGRTVSRTGICEPYHECTSFHVFVPLLPRLVGVTQ
jgi:hypothetical protein